MTTYQRTLQPMHRYRSAAPPKRVLPRRAHEEYGSRQRCQARTGADSTVAMIHLEVEEERLCHRSTKTCCDSHQLCINTQPLHRCPRCTNNHHVHTRYAPAAALSATTFWTPPLSASKSKAGQDSADPCQRSHWRCRCFRSPASVKLRLRMPEYR